MRTEKVRPKMKYFKRIMDRGLEKMGYDWALLTGIMGCSVEMGYMYYSGKRVPYARILNRLFKFVGLGLSEVVLAMDEIKELRRYYFIKRNQKRFSVKQRALRCIKNNFLVDKSV